MKISIFLLAIVGMAEGVRLVGSKKYPSRYYTRSHGRTIRLSALLRTLEKTQKAVEKLRQMKKIVAKYY